tara:strand:+ start:1622 stop:2833 length:1212 start_codon:yes stop_codon:yes gene_type:complete
MTKKNFKKNFKFIDLFSGIGGFHIAMESLGGECVFSSEIDKYAIENYYENFGIDSDNDITKTDLSKIPDHDVLCAGFPCQAFSKAGNQNGFSDTRGTLFFDIERIIKKFKTKFIILENVRNLVSHDKGKTWKVIKNSLENLGYLMTETPLLVSPHHLGIPQLRERVFILGIHSSLEAINLNIDINKKGKNDFSIYETGVLEDTNDDKYKISEYEEKALNIWDEFIQGVDDKVIGFPIWTSEFKKTTDISDLPKWQKEFCEKNRNFYERNKSFIDKWLKKYNDLEDLKPTDRKFEWQCGNDCDSIWDTIIQFRPSGIRVKRPTTFPALVAMVHVPIIGKLKRKMTPREAANLQSYPKDFKIHKNDKQAYKQFGNSVNVEVVRFLSKQLFELDRHNKGQARLIKL